jgi:hypothetical protein
MATTFEEIYARCRGRIKDYDKEGYTDEMFAQAEFDLLQNAIDDFSEICTQDLTDYDVELQQFNITLTRKEQSILALSMIVHWLEPYVYNSDALKNAMSTKDFTFFSPAKLLEQMITLLKQSQKKLQAEMNLYSFKSNSVSAWTV